MSLEGTLGGLRDVQEEGGSLLLELDPDSLVSASLPSLTTVTTTMKVINMN